MQFYVWYAGEPVRSVSQQEWAQYMQGHDNRRVEFTRVDEIEVSTVFLGLDHNFIQSGDPILFETMVFGDPSGEEYTSRYRTEVEARAGHAQIVLSIVEDEPLPVSVMPVQPKPSVDFNRTRKLRIRRK